MIPVYVNEIKTALSNKLYFSALALSLTLPDMCGSAEYPKDDVGKRYINWYDKYLGDYFSNKGGTLYDENPRLSGELVYNLRNTFLHQGVPNINSGKVKEESNQIDRFILVLGDGSVIQDASLRIQSSATDKVYMRAILVDVTFLCNCICDCANWYYENNKEKFKFDYNVVSQEELIISNTENAEEA